ncbi:MAG: hypothetical protein GX783_12935 [Clostridiales bacterium]|nr:hypothetical protein [Clostridiales bacterium]
MTCTDKIKKDKYLIGLDLGTTSIKGVLMSTDGNIISSEKAETMYSRPKEGWVQFDVKQFYERISAVIQRLVRVAPSSSLIIGISIASASGNTVLVDQMGTPMLPAISWMDKRVTDELELVIGKLTENESRELIGWPLNKTFPLAHLSWIKCHIPHALNDADHICMTTDYVNYRLTGSWGIDPSTATTFFLQDQVKGHWHTPFLDLLGIPSSKISTILPTGTVLGGITEKAAEETCLLPGTPVVLGAFDHPCAARGSGVFDVGQMLISCGTSWVGFYPIQDRAMGVKQRLLIDPFLHADGAWGAMFSLPAIGTKIDELICRYISDASDRYKEFDRLSMDALPGAGGLFINPFSNELNIDENRYTKSNIARAIMEGTVYLLKAKVDTLRKAGMPIYSLTMVGGPSDTYPWPQILCDILGIQLSIVNGSNAGAVGAAILAGVGVGVYTNERDAFKKASFKIKTYYPDEANHLYCKKRYIEFSEVSEL